MTCKFSGWDGKCDLWDGDDVMFEHIFNSCDSEGHCMVEDNEDPSMSCEDYEDAKLVILAEEFGIPYEIKTITEGDSEWGGIGTYYGVDYCDFGMTDEDLEELVEGCCKNARRHVSNMACLREEVPRLWKR